MLQAKVVATENQNIHFKFDKTFPENRPICDNVKKHGTVRQATGGTVPQRTQGATCLVDN